jgi:hypothetical protein
MSLLAYRYQHSHFHQLHSDTFQIALLLDTVGTLYSDFTKRTNNTCSVPVSVVVMLTMWKLSYTSIKQINNPLHTFIGLFSCLPPLSVCGIISCYTLPMLSNIPHNTNLRNTTQRYGMSATTFQCFPKEALLKMKHNMLTCIPST